jgi:hypothetical protein
MLFTFNGRALMTLHGVSMREYVYPERFISGSSRTQLRSPDVTGTSSSVTSHFFLSTILLPLSHHAPSRRPTQT